MTNDNKKITEKKCNICGNKMLINESKTEYSCACGTKHKVNILLG